MEQQSGQMLSKINLLNQIGIALSSEKDFSSLLEQILLGAKRLTNADGGTIYLLREGDKENKKDDLLEMVIVQTDSLGLHLGGTTGAEIPFSPIKLYNSDGSPNLKMVVTRTVLEDKPINIADAYAVDEYDFSGTYKFDEKTGYHSQSFLAVPMKNHENDIIGVLQLLNAQTQDKSQIIPFTIEDQNLVESLASQAAVAITNKQLIDGLNELFNSLVRLIATAIDEKSPYTSGHCKRLPVLTMLLAEAAHETNSGELKDFKMTDKDRYELEVAAWLHDCGKITTPEYVMDKATKLEKIVDRIELIDQRLEILRRDAELQKYQALLQGLPEAEVQKQYQQKLDYLNDAQQFLEKYNTGGEFMPDEAMQKVHELAKLEWQDYSGTTQKLLTDDEIHNLCIAKGTLTSDERQIINNHIVATIKMLGTLPFPKHLRNVPEYAGGHHERVDGKGYPKGLTKKQMSVQARIMAIADVFEALTARDRPYKQPMKLSQALSILDKMQEDGHIDPELYKVFVDKSVHKKYGAEFLMPEQIDM